MMPIAHLNGTELYYQIKGEGPPLLFLHPPMLNSQIFYYQWKSLSNHFQVILMDIRGHGKSAYSKETLTYPLIVEDIKKLLQYLGIKQTYLCGYSMAGSIVLEFLLRAPEQGLGAVLIGAIAHVDDWWLKLQLRAGKLLSSRSPSSLAMLLSVSNANNLSIFRSLFSFAKQTHAQNSQQFFAYGLKHDCTARLSEIHQPILLVYGDKDKHFHPYAARLHQQLPQNQIYLMSEASHQIPTKKAALLNQAITEFISQHQPTMQPV